jgi:hypothetical protein
MRRLQRALAAIRLFMSVEHRTIGAVALRVMVGSATLALYAFHLQQRAFLWGSNGVFPRDVSSMFLSLKSSWSLYNLAPNETWESALFILGMVVTALFTAGFSTRVTSVLFFVFTFSLYTRNEILLDGGNNLLILIAFFLMFVDSSGKHIPGRSAQAANPFVALVHNLAVVAIIGQVSILYFTSAWAKMMGHMWQDGTAVYYVLRTSEFHLSRFTDPIIHDPFLVVALTYGTIILQIGFPFMIWNRTLKYPWILGACIFHLGIAYFMGLVWFSLTMLSCELILIDDRAYARVWDAVTTAWARSAAFARAKLRLVRERRQGAVS